MQNALTKWLTRIIALILLPVLIAAGISQALWGYPVTPPPVEAITGDLAHVNEIAYLRMTERGKFALATPPDLTLSIPGPSPYAPELSGGNTLRIYNFAAGASVASPTSTDTDWQLPALNAALQQAGWQFLPDDAPDTIKGCCVPRGYIISGQTTTGKTRYLVGLSSSQIRNDHYFYYEGLLGPSEDDGLTLLTDQHFRYDIAGLEGFQFPELLILVYMFIVLPILLAWSMMRAIVYRPTRRKRKPSPA